MLTSIWRFTKKKTESELEPEQRRPSHILNSPILSQPSQLILNDLDFRTAFVQARKERPQWSRRNVEHWILPLVIYRFAFGFLDRPVAFKGMYSTVSDIETEHRPIQTESRSLMEYFQTNPNLLQRTFEIGVELVKAKRARDRSLELWEFTEAEERNMMDKELEEWDLLTEDENFMIKTVDKLRDGVLGDGDMGEEEVIRPGLPRNFSLGGMRDEIPGGRLFRLP